MPTCQAAYPNALTGKSAGAALGQRREGIEDNARLWPDSDQPKFLPSDSYRAESGPILARRTLSLREKRLDKLVPINALPGSKSRRATPPTTCIKHIPPRPRRTRKLFGVKLPSAPTPRHGRK